MPRIAYLAHDLGDANVDRRVAMFRLGGAEVSVAGLVRGAANVRTIQGSTTLPLGRTQDARLAQRIPQIGHTALFGMRRLVDHVGDADAVVARNLEMLVLGAQLARRMTRPRLVYECLDIHRLLTASGLFGATLRSVERRLGRSVDLVLTSSPAFVEHHLGAFADRVRLVENKVLLQEQDDAGAEPTPTGPPWRIGWFGALRCRRSFELLAALAERGKGRIEVVIRGRPSPAIFPDMAAEVARHPHLRYEGPYANPRDLAKIYREVHLAWCLDFYEEGKNSAWLLPNRLYEGCYHRTLPIALASVETGRFLARHGLGLLLEDASAAALEDLTDGVTPDSYRRAMAHLEVAPRKLWQADRSDCLELVQAVTGVRPGGASAASAA